MEGTSGSFSAWSTHPRVSLFSNIQSIFSNITGAHPWQGDHRRCHKVEEAGGGQSSCKDRRTVGGTHLGTWLRPARTWA